MVGSDASIYGLIRQPAPPVDPMAQYGRALQIKGLVGQQELQGLQTQQAKQALADDQAYRDVFSGMQQGQTLKDILPQLMRANPKAGIALQNQLLEQEGKQATIRKTGVEADAAIAKQGRDLIAAATPESLPGVLEWGVKNNQQWALKAPAQIMSDPAAFSQWQRQNVLGADEWLKRNAPTIAEQNTVRGQDLTAATARRGQDISAATTRRGQDQPIWDADRGVFVPRPGVGGGMGAPAAVGAPAPAGAVPSAPAQPGAAPGVFRPAGLPQSKAEIEKAEKEKTKAADVQKVVSAYAKARDGLLSGLEGSWTGPIVGRGIPFTAKQQIAQGGAAAIIPILKQIFRVAGEGVFTDKDQQNLIDMVPDRTVEPEARAAMIANIDDIISAKLGMPVPERVIKDDGAGKTDKPVRIAGDDGYNALPKGALYVGPDGVTRRK